MSGHEKKITVTRTRSRSCCTRDPGSRADYFSCKILGFVWNLIASLVRKLKISINNSLHTRSNIALVLFLDSLKAFQLHFCQLLGSKTLLFSSLLKRINYSMCFLFSLDTTIHSMHLFKESSMDTRRKS